MRLPARQQSALPGIVGIARVGRRARSLAPRVRPGDIAVLDHPDLDRASAQALVDAGVVAVIDASPMISGRYPNLGPAVLAQAGVALLDSVGPQTLAAIRDGVRIRLHGADLFRGEEHLGHGRWLDADEIERQMLAARAGLVAHLETFTHNSAEFLRREEDLLLHGRGLPRPSAPLADRPVVVVAQGQDAEAELRAIRSFIREQMPVMIGVDGGADLVAQAGHPVHIVVIDARTDDVEWPSARVLRAADDVVLRIEPGIAPAAAESLDRLGVQPLRIETAATAEDAALLLAHAGQPSVIVAVGAHATLEEFLDRQRSGLASTYLTRLRVAPELVDASAVPTLYSGRVAPRHLAAVAVAGLIALGAATSVTPLGHEWFTAVATAFTSFRDALTIHL